MKAKCLVMGFLLLLALVGIKETEAYIIDFESLSDSEVVTNQFSGFGVTFSNATALTSGISLNEFEFPPYSGDNVVYDDGGEMIISFTIPVLDAGGYFTYMVPLTLFFFDALDNPLGTVNSAFTSNMGISGDAGSLPNEFLNFTSASGISKMVVAGDIAGGSFTLDDLTATPLSVPVPEPGIMMLFGICGMIGMAGYGLSFIKRKI
ncbi:MAG: PEP-CTERM sorting domain-containing protein [Deltaproteobacteria bacterium]|nr:PEP-CTERM sorting domain-containing protein [Deltaproteobacteria bacterium]